MTVIINGTDNSASTPAVTGTDGDTGMFYPAANTVALSTGGSERMRVDSSGNVGIGTSSPNNRLHVLGGTDTRSRVEESGGTFFDAVITNSGHFFDSTGTGDWTFNKIGSANMVFKTNNAERARITSSGNLLVGTTTAPQGNSNTLQAVSAANTEFAVAAVHPATNEDIRGVLSIAPNTNNDDGYFYVGRRQSGDRFHVRTSGNVANTNNSYGAISDVKLKQDVVDAGSQWDDIKNLRVRKFRFNNDPTGPLQIGVVAQEIEEVSPGLIDESPDYEEVEVTDEEGNVKTKSQATGTTTKSVKYSVLYMKAVKALQEAIERIETLEAKVAALEGAE
jgi:hypothetical protein